MRWLRGHGLVRGALARFVVLAAWQCASRLAAPVDAGQQRVAVATAEAAGGRAEAVAKHDGSLPQQACGKKAVTEAQVNRADTTAAAPCLAPAAGGEPVDVSPRAYPAAADIGPSPPVDLTALSVLRV
ncbi:MAG: hypothetical protein LBV78_07860 [Kitasatospora sp.]|jgi:hypothetical protein|nr:hypothetical protein [Kitasatospora sp.]